MGSIYRRAKESLYNVHNTVAGGDGAYGFDALSALPFETIYTTVSSGAVSKDTVQTRLWLPQNCVIVKAVFGVQTLVASTGTSATNAYNVVVGEGTSYTNSVAGTLAVAGNQLFDADVSVIAVGVSAPGSLVSKVSRPEAIYAAGTELTLRVHIGGGTTNGTIVNAQVVLLIAPYDPLPEHTSAIPVTDF